MKELGEEKWLGDLFSGNLKESVMATITSRQGKVRRAAYRAQRVGGFLTGLLLWESCCVPSLIHNCSTWVGSGRRRRRS